MDHGIDDTSHCYRIKPQYLGARSRLIAIVLACGATLQLSVLFADTVPVRHTEGVMHGFLVLRTLEGKSIADGQLTQDARVTQDARGGLVTVHLIFRFKDGSIYDDTTVFSQRGTFRLVSDHLYSERTILLQAGGGHHARRFHRPGEGPLQREQQQTESLCSAA
jgi:hypothetical protein